MVYSYVIYFGVVLLSTFFAFLAQYFAKTNDLKTTPNPFFYWISLLSLVLVMGLRSMSVGVDGTNYYYNYLKANSMDLFTYYQNHITEPGFYLLYKLSFLLGNHQWLFVIAAFITVLFFYKAISYQMDKISFPLAIFIFASTQYFYYFGIMRMGIAVAIIAYAYKYILEGNNKRYILWVIVATTFHYSALFALVVLFFNRNKNGFFKKENILKIAVVIPLGFLAVRFIIFPFLTADRYSGYVESSGVFDIGFITTLPLLVIFSFFYNRLTIAHPHFQFYYFLFLAKVVTELFSPIIGTGRMVWYLNFSICFLFPIILKINNDKKVKVLILIIAILYSVFYSYNAYFGDSWRGENMFPYKLFYIT